MKPPSGPKKQTQFKPNFFKGQNELRAYPNNRVVMRPSEKFEAKAAGQKGSEAWFSPRREHFWPTTQASGFAAGRNRAGYLDRLLTSLAKKSGHTRLAGVLKIVCKNAPFGYTHPDCRATAGFAQTRAIHVERKGFGDGGK